MSAPRILLLDEASPSLRALAATLELEGFRVRQTAEPDEALSAIRAGECEVVLSEVHLAAQAVLAEVRASNSAPPVIVFDDFASLGGPSQALREGAFDALARPISDEEVLRAVRRALQSHALRLENERLKHELDGRATFGELFSVDPRMRRIFETLAAVADSRATLLLSGESGTGKTQLAHAVHKRSARARGPFVEVNCGALPSNLLESELFGHVRGAFTGAVKDRLGKFEQAAGGTILLDEIGTASPELQLKLLRVLEEGRFERVGDTRTRNVDARVITATNVDLEQEVAAGRFRADLFYRIHVVAVEVPPLRARLGDVAQLAEQFLTRFARRHGREVRELSSAARQRLCAHAWPGNVRELENAIERAVLISQGARLEPGDLFPERAAGSAGAHGTQPGFEGWQAGPPDELKLALEGPERWLLLRALERHAGNRSAAARTLGINRTTLFNKMRKYALLSFPVRT
ncbi:MAG: sigma-54-dependent Fis family transcriptional regulator [Planctomycetes bacterium]|nr:sigma-54-dependent Fis family transcriptional regulator [Planctomycetota bacterium]